MEEYPEKTKTFYRQKPRKRVILLGFASLFVAMTLVTLLTTNVFKQHEQQKQATRSAEVLITKAGFKPATLSVKRGTKIIWVNTDGGLHQVASNPYPKDTDLATLKSEILNNDQTYTYTASTAGVFGYHDQMQPTINGTIVVQQ